MEKEEENGERSNIGLYCKDCKKIVVYTYKLSWLYFIFHKYQRTVTKEGITANKSRYMYVVP